MSSIQSYLVLARATPYGSHLPRAAIDLALTAAAFEQDVTVVFLDEGILQLLDTQETTQSQIKNIGKMIPALSLYEVNRVLYHEESAKALAVNPQQFPADLQPVDDKMLANMISTADHVMVF